MTLPALAQLRAVTAMEAPAGMHVTDRPLIRPPDPTVTGRTVRIAPYDNAEATRRFIHYAFRDAHTALDLTYAHGGFWERPFPPGLAVTTSNIDPASGVDLHLDFTATGLPDGAYDLVVYDPPHLTDLGEDSIMGRRFGTVKGTPRLHRMVTDGVREAWRISRVGILVKLAHHSHGSRFLALTQWVNDELGAELYFSAHTTRPPLVAHRRQRVPLNNGADWLIFRKDSGTHKDFDRLYERQQASRVATLGGARRCAICDTALDDRRRDAATCSDTCRQQRRRRKAS